MTVLNTVQSSHLVVNDNHKFVYCGDALQIIIKEKTIQYRIQGQLLSI